MNERYSDFDIQKKEKLEELKNVKDNELKDLVYRMQLIYDEMMDELELKYISPRRLGYSLNPGIYEVVDLNSTLKYISPDHVKASVTIDVVRLYSNLKTNQILITTNKSFSFTKLGFTQSPQGPLNNIERFYQILPGSYKSDKPINITGSDKIHLKCDCIQGSIVNGIREPVLYSFALSSPPGHKI